ncbi:testis-expressed protein 2 isoform X2 [Coccinella septempunctata]|uniref:testis-expressed protein 2 isoform X2 n=1 Tax=Coccinella septempunctata TaxID=41139 RepID=UPI001D087C43|nr:testis-expressed protein 2 isoform X2 [Coccinella septempunctata]
MIITVFLLEYLLRKSITTSVPSISIKFHANAEQIEELYGSDDELKTEINEKKLSAATREKGSNSTGNIQDTAEGSPLKYLRLNKRSNSTEVTTISDSSPPSDPWKFFSEIKEKIAKSVEDKITEIKAKNQEDGSPSKGKTEKTSRENSNLSDSEELSESSLSRTCGIASTTEGAEMASDEESISLKNDTPTNLKSSPSTPTVRQRFRLLKTSKNGMTTCKEGTVSMSSLTKMYNVNVDDTKQMLPDQTEEVESGVDALADVDFKNTPKGSSSKMVHSRSLVLSSLEKSIDNIEIDEDGTVNIREVAGIRWKGEGSDDKSEVKTVFAPTGFVDFRYRIPKENSNFLLFVLVLIISILYLLIQRYSVYTAGMIAGISITCFSYYIMNKISPGTEKCKKETAPKDIWEVPAIKEYQPMLKYEGWLNEYPENYDPTTYHISLTQPVYLKLEGNWLRISNTTSKVPKRAMWNEKEIVKNFKQRRIYNLLGAKVCLLPLGLAKIRHWSKKYPICISIPRDQFEFEDDLMSKDTDDEKDSPPFLKKGSAFNFRKKKSSTSLPQRFSKLVAEQDEFYTDVDSRSDTSSPIHEEEKMLTEGMEKNLDHAEDNNGNLDDTWSNCTLDESPTETRIYLFGRTDREKEDWFRRLCMASHPQPSNVPTENAGDLKKVASVESILKESEYTLYMSSILKAFKKRDEQNSIFSNSTIEMENVSWVNAFLGRILFDCMCDEIFTSKIKERIQRKLAAIKLPYFIEELSITELNLGKTVPLFKKISKPTMDDRGLWVDMNMIYEGLVVLTLTTKLNLMKLKQPPTEAEREVHSKSAIFNSDVDDSAESSSEDESIIFSSATDATNSVPVPPVNKSKKLMKMVDKITESKFFQAATDNKYIKRAMEGVSNTELRLKVEVRILEGTLVLNIPPPPSDRVWIGFRPLPELSLSAHPVVGERNISFIHVTNLIEKKLIEEFQKLLVIPNMEDVIIPVMMSKLPN